jgi:REP element-mobilizing transposase RayT
MNNLSYKQFYHRNLPHYQPKDGIFAISFRLAFTLPAVILQKLKEQKDFFNITKAKLKGKEKKLFVKEFNKTYFENFDSYLAKYSSGNDWLKQDNIAKIVYGAMLFFKQQKYDMIAFCIMPNHVHAIMRPYSKGEDCYSLSAILHSIKSYSANKCNAVLNRTGSFWKNENYDHAIRNEEDFGYQLQYLLYNPVKAKLVERWQQWKFTYLKEDILNQL